MREGGRGTRVEGCQGSGLGDGEWMHEGRAGEGSGESPQLQVQLLSCPRPIPTLVSRAVQEEGWVESRGWGT